jgi:hypothetical protein
MCATFLCSVKPIRCRPFSIGAAHLTLEQAHPVELH